MDRRKILTLNKEETMEKKRSVLETVVWIVVVFALIYFGARLAFAEDIDPTEVLPEGMALAWQNEEEMILAQVDEVTVSEEDKEEGRIGDWIFRPDASLPFFMVEFKPTKVTFNEAGVGIGLSVTRETGSVLDPKFALYIYPKSRAESGSMDLAFGGEVSLLSMGRFHLITVGGMYSITEDKGALTVGVSAVVL
jgi:hypothetical protein